MNLEEYAKTFFTYTLWFFVGSVLLVIWTSKLKQYLRNRRKKKSEVSEDFLKAGPLTEEQERMLRDFWISSRSRQFTQLLEAPDHTHTHSYAIPIDRQIREELRQVGEELRRSRPNVEINCPRCGHRWVSHRNPQIATHLMSRRCPACNALVLHCFVNEDDVWVYTEDMITTPPINAPTNNSSRDIINILGTLPINQVVCKGCLTILPRSGNYSIESSDLAGIVICPSCYEKDANLPHINSGEKNPLYHRLHKRKLKRRVKVK